MKKLFALTLVVCGLSQAAPVDAVAIVVEGEPITLSEIKHIRKKHNISKEKAIDLLITDRLKEARLKKVVVTPEEIDNKIAQIAARNGLSIEQMQAVFKQRGKKWSLYRKEVEKILRQEKFFKQHVLSSLPEPSEDELKLFYLKHKKNFMIPTKIVALHFQAPSKAALASVAKHGSHPDATREKLTLTLDDNPKLFMLLAQVPPDSFTPVLQTSDGFSMFKVLKYIGKVQLPYKAARAQVLSAWQAKKRAGALNEYFQKERSNAQIEVLRN